MSCTSSPASRSAWESSMARAARPRWNRSPAKRSRFAARSTRTRRPCRAVDLLLALPRPKVMRRLWAQIAAMGVGQIILTNAERVERNYFDTHVLTPECYRPLLVEGLQQARDTRLPRVSIHRQFKVLVEDELDRPVPGRTAPGRRPGRDAPATSAARERAARTRSAGHRARRRLERVRNGAAQCARLHARRAWARGRSAPTPRASRCSRSCTVVVDLGACAGLKLHSHSPSVSSIDTPHGIGDER